MHCYILQALHVLMVMFVSLVDWYQQRELYRCVWEGDGENCALMVGATKRHLLCVDNLDYLLLVSVCQCYHIIKFFKFSPSSNSCNW